MNMELENILKSIYYDTSHPAGYSSFEKLYKAAKKIDSNIRRKDVKNWWIGEFTPTLHKPVVRKFKRNPIIVELIDQQWEADLVEMQHLKSKNSNFCYILTVIDCLSKYAWAVGLKNKKAESVRSAFESIFEKDRRLPFCIRTDQGKEFVNKEFKKFMKKCMIHHFTSKNKDVKCAIVERFNRTLKGRMFKYFTANFTERWIDELDNLVSAYNNAYHSTIKRSPNQAILSKSEDLFKVVYKVNNISELYKKVSKDFKIDDTVRTVYEKKPFDKGYYPNWTDTISKIENISDEPHEQMLQVENINQRLYPQQVQIVRENEYRVQEVLDERMRNGKKQYFVKWLNYPDHFNSWVDESDMITR